MTVTAIRSTDLSQPAPVALRRRLTGVKFLQWHAATLMIIPSTTIIGAIGAPGYPASLIGLFMFGIYAATVLLGFHDPLRHRHPIQPVICLMWISVLATYVLMDRAVLSPLQMKGADRVLFSYVVYTSVALIAAEWLHSLEDVRRVLRVLCWSAAIAGLVAALQYAIRLDLSLYVRSIPGFTQNHINPAIIARGALARATGTALTPIELGVMGGMLLPIAVYLGLFDEQKSKFKRWAPAVFILMACGTSVSRSGIIAVVVAFGMLVALMPAVPRLNLLAAVPFALAGVFMSAHGLIGTLSAFFTVGSSDSSIEYRLHDYPVVERLWSQAPWFGHGGGTYLPANPLDIFDNQYLTTAVEFGGIGVFMMLVFFVVPPWAALIARRHSRDPELRVLLAALAGAGFAAALCSVTFDSMSFPLCVNTYAIVMGLIGACWRLVVAERAGDTSAPPNAGPRPAPTDFRRLGPVWPGRASS